MIIWRNQGNNLTGVTVTENGGTVTATGGNIAAVRTSGSSLLGFRKTDQVAGASGQKWYGFLTITGGAFSDIMVGLIDEDSIDYTKMVGCYVTGAGNFNAWEESANTADNSAQGGSLDTEYEISFEILVGGAVRIKRDSTTLGNTVVGTSGDYTAKNLRLMASIIGSTAATFNFDEVLATDNGSFTPPVPSTPSATTFNQSRIDLAWADGTIAAANTDVICVERSLTGSGSGFSEITTIAPGVQAYSNTSLTPGTQYFYRFRSRVTVNGTQYHSAYTSEVEDTTDPNLAPVANAGPNQVVTYPDAATLVGSATDDGYPNPPATITYLWTKVSGPGTVNFLDATDPTTTATVTASGTYVLRLTASDSVLNHSDDITVVWNAPPVVDAGANRKINAGALTTTLEGSVSDDALPNPPGTATIAWSKISGPGTVTFDDATDPETEVEVSELGTYVLRLSVDDGDTVETDDVQLIFSDDIPCHQASIHLFITPLTDADTYGTEVEITEYLLADSLSEVAAFIDSEDYEVGIFSYGNLTFALTNETGKFNESTDSRSIFTYYRDLSKVRIVYRITEITRSNAGIVTDSTTTDETLFTGLLRDEATRLDVLNNSIAFECLSLESIISTVRISDGGIADDTTTTAAILAVLQSTKVTELLTVDAGNIDPDLSINIDDGTYFDALNGLDALKVLLSATNSVLLIRDGVVYVQDRAVNDTLPVVELFGANDIHGRENIVDLSDYNNGFHRIANSIRVGRVDAINSGSISEIGLRQKQFDFEFVTDAATEQDIADRMLAEFVVPKTEVTVRIPLSLGRDIQLLQEVSVNWPLYMEPDDERFFPIVGGTEYSDDEAPYPVEIGSIEILPNVRFKAIEIRHDLVGMETTLKLRQVGTDFEDGYE